MTAPRLWSQWSAFAGALTIPSRDEGLVRFRPYPTQTYLVQQILRALAAGKREILILKARQLGISTVLMIFSLFWLLRHRGLQGALITESDRTKEYLRGTFGKLAAGLAPAWSYPILFNNRYGVQWASGSRLVYETAGLRKNTALGKGRGLSYLHATEISEWGDAEGVDSLRAALSERHPAACYLWESTARGFGFFWEMWHEFSRAVTLEAIFLGWWRHPGYRKATGTPEYTVYWDGRLTTDERAWQEQLTRRWGVTLTAEQWAWYRWKAAEKSRSAIWMHQNFPTLPEHAFQATGGGFLDEATAYRYRERLGQAPRLEAYRYEFGGSIEASALHPADAGRAPLLVWEPPRPGAHYVIAADPSFGAGGGGDSDCACCQVWRAERERLIQVAAFAANDLPLHEFAWVCMHLAGSYGRPPGQSYFILELNGPGRAVLQEIQRLLWYGTGSSQPADLQNVLGGIQQYIYRKPDSLSGGGGFYQWLSTHQTKKLLMEKLRDCLLTQSLVLREPALVEELASLRRVGDAVEAPGAGHDDRAITCALAIQSWQEQAVPYLAQLPPTDPDAPPGDGLPVAPPVAQSMVHDFFQQLGVPSPP